MGVARAVDRSEMKCAMILTKAEEDMESVRGNKKIRRMGIRIAAVTRILTIISREVNAIGSDLCENYLTLLNVEYNLALTCFLLLLLSCFNRMRLVPLRSFFFN